MPPRLSQIRAGLSILVLLEQEAMNALRHERISYFNALFQFHIKQNRLSGVNLVDKKGDAAYVHYVPNFNCVIFPIHKLLDN